MIEVSNGLYAITLLDCGTAIDLLMADLDMPEIRGEEMVERIRASRPDLPVLYVTGNIDSLLDKRPMQWMEKLFWEKPFNEAGVLEAVSLNPVRRAQEEEVVMSGGCFVVQV